MMGHNRRFKGVIWKIIPKLSLLPFLTWSFANSADPDFDCHSIYVFQILFYIVKPTDQFLGHFQYFACHNFWIFYGEHVNMK